MESKGNRARALVAGDRIAVVAPSGPVDRIALAAGIAVLRKRRFCRGDAPGPASLADFLPARMKNAWTNSRSALDAPDIRGGVAGPWWLRAESHFAHAATVRSS